MMRRAEDVTKLMREDQGHTRCSNDDVGSWAMPGRRDVRSAKTPRRLKPLPGRCALRGRGGPSIDDGVDDKHVDGPWTESPFESVARPVVLEHELVLRQSMQLHPGKRHARIGEIRARRVHPGIDLSFWDVFSDMDREGKHALPVGPSGTRRCRKSADDYNEREAEETLHRE